MAQQISSGDLQFSIVPETVLGTTPTTGVTRHELPVKSGQALPTYSANEVASETMRPNRSSNGSRRGNGSGTGNFAFRAQKNAAIELLMASAVSGAWAGNVLKGGKTDSSFSTIVKARNDVHFVYAGCVANSFGFTATAADKADFSFGMVCTKRTTSAVDNAIVVTSAGNTVEWMGSETSVAIDGVTLQYTEVNVDSDQDRGMRNVLGSSTPVGVSANGLREVTCTVKAYRESLAVEAAITGAPQEVVINVGTEGDGYIITLPAAIGMVPQDETEDDLMVTLTFSAKYDEVEQTNIKIEKWVAA